MLADELQLQIVDVRPPIAFGDLDTDVRTGVLTGRNVNHLPCISRGGRLMSPTVILVHFTGGPGDANRSIKVMNERGVSSHLVVNRDGTIVQAVPFTRVAHHAGKGVWGPYKDSLNTHSIGIETCNLGPMWRNKKKELIDSYGLKRIDRSTQWMAHKNAGAVDMKQLLGKNYDKIVKQGVAKPELNDCEWEIFPEDQKTSLQRLCSMLLTRYPTIREIIGHDDYAHTRKIDPGPALRLEALLGWLPNARTIYYQDDHRRPGYTDSLSSTSYVRNLVTSRTYASGNVGRDIG